MAVSRIFGPLILMPTIIAAFAIVSQAHPDRVIRAFCLVASALAIIAPTLLELGGLLPRSVSFTVEGLRVLPQMTELPKTATLLFVIVANACIAVVPALFIGRLRGDLTRSQERQILHTWHFRRFGEDLVSPSTS